MKNYTFSVVVISKLDH